MGNGTGLVYWENKENSLWGDFVRKLIRIKSLGEATGAQSR